MMANTPTAFEQAMLEYVNRARTAPTGEYGLAVDASASQSGIASALQFFGVDLDAYRTQMAAFDAVAPLAWNTALATSADTHSQLMIDMDTQSHNLPGEAGLGARITDAGYTNWSSISENIYAYSQDALYGHIGFMVDWGYDDVDFDANGSRYSDWQSRGDGIQDAAGHRATIMSANLRDIGISALAETDADTGVGPWVVTQNFGRQGGVDPAQLLGVLIADADGDQFYDIGEGMGGITVTATNTDNGDVVSTRTWESGGYQLELAAGSYSVQFSGGDLTGVITKQITMTTENQKLDGYASQANTAPTDGPDLIVGTALDDEIYALGGADWITLAGGSDTIDGGEGRDMLSFSNLDETLGRTNADYRLNIDMQAGTAVSHDGSQLILFTNIERLTATSYADRIRGTDGDDEIRGLGDYDWITATGGNDVVDGGSGQDMISFLEYQSTAANIISDVFGSAGAPPSGAQASGVVVDFANPDNNTGLASGLSLTSVERVTGSSRQDVFYGDGEQNDFRGLGDYDWFVSSAGGRERYFGGDGVDTVTYFNTTSGITANLSNGVQINGRETGFGSRGDAARDLYFEIENLVGSHFDDSLTGSSERNQLNGLDGDDFIFAKGGVDYIKGGLGNDTIDGGAGSDYALFDGYIADYTLTRGTGLESNSVTVSGADGTDSLIDVEYFRFDDGDVTIWSL
jgi:uncharacterized protein YkwD